METVRLRACMCIPYGSFVRLVIGSELQTDTGTRTKCGAAVIQIYLILRDADGMTL